MTDERFDELLNEIRQESVSPEQAGAARDRVWQRLNASQLCAAFRPEFGDYLAGGLSDARRLLMEDHLGRCPECRRELARLQGHGSVAAMPSARTPRIPGWTRWAIAAGVLLGGLYLGRGIIDAALAPSGPRATVVSVSGGVFSLAHNSLQPGAPLAEGEVVRTTQGAHAILALADGSRVEMNQRTELAVTRVWSGQTVRLDRGDIIVEAARQRRGHLRVVTGDSIASVKGTVFAVSSGESGSVVTVVEGSVNVSQPGSDRVLARGQHAASNPALDRVQTRQAVSWSRDAEKYYSLLGEFAQIEKRLADTATPLRTDPQLLRYLPAGVQVYVAIPNLGGTLRQALFLIDQRARENPALNEWWSSPQGEEMRTTLDRIQAVTPLLGEEVVLAVSKTPGSRNGEFPLLLAQVQPGRADALRDAIQRIAADHPGNLHYRVAPDLLLVSESAPHLAAMAGQLGAGASSPFAAEIAARYRDGVSLLAGIDITTFGSDVEQNVARILGIPNMRYLFLEQAWGGGRGDNQATLSFLGSRTGLASWLSSPGAAGSAEYVSPDAIAAFSASTRDPRQAFDELLSQVGGDFAAGVHKFESETGVNIATDIAAALGSDFTFAIERPSVPLPGWVAAFEVVRPGVLDDTIRRVGKFDNQVALDQETVNGRVWNSLQTSPAGPTIYWTYDRGYLIASMDRALASRAIAIRESGSSLVRSAVFQQSYPASASVHHSGFMWVNTGGALAGLAGLTHNSALQNLAANREPLLITVDGEMERIHAASRSRLTSMILDMMLVRGTSGQ